MVGPASSPTMLGRPLTIFGERKLKESERSRVCVCWWCERVVSDATMNLNVYELGLWSELDETEQSGGSKGKFVEMYDCVSVMR